MSYSEMSISLEAYLEMKSVYKYSEAAVLVLVLPSNPQEVIPVIRQCYSKDVSLHLILVLNLSYREQQCSIVASLWCLPI